MRSWLPHILVGIALAVVVVAFDWWALNRMIDAAVTPARAEPSEGLRQIYALAACIGVVAFGLLPYLWALAVVSVAVNAPAMFVVMCLHDPVMAEVLLRPLIDLVLLPPPDEATRIFAIALGAEAVGAVTGQLARMLVTGAFRRPVCGSRTACI